MKETEIAQDVVNYLSDYDLYFEVWDVDIIAKIGNILTSVEVKTTLNFKVIEQAFRNREQFHYSYIAIPHGQNRNFQYRICRDYGIGVLELSYYKCAKTHCVIQERIKPKLNRSPHALGEIKLINENKKSIPGAPGNSGTTRTAFVITVELIKKYISRHPGCTFKELFKNIDHHYASFSSAKGSIYSYIKSGIIKGISIDKDKLYYSLKDDKKCQKQN